MSQFLSWGWVLVSQQVLQVQCVDHLVEHVIPLTALPGSAVMDVVYLTVLLFL